jgi:DNA-binding NarL/FixJ family response regulator
VQAFEQSATFRVLVVEDNPAMQKFFSQSVSNCKQLALVDCVSTVAHANRWLDANPGLLDVLLVDLGLPDGSGLEVIRHALKLNPQCAPLVISMFGDDENILTSIEAGALGYLHKDSLPTDIAQSILAIRAGASPISPMIARRVLSKYRQVSANAVPAPETELNQALQQSDPGQFGQKPQIEEPRPVLSRRELEVLTLISRGFSYAEIAQMINLSLHTVQSHIKNTYSKLSANSKIEAVSNARNAGLLLRFEE